MQGGIGGGRHHCIRILILKGQTKLISYKSFESSENILKIPIECETSQINEVFRQTYYLELSFYVQLQ